MFGLYPFLLLFVIGQLLLSPALEAKSIFKPKSHTPQKYYVMPDPSYTPGLFSCFLTALGCLQRYEAGFYAGVEIDFQDHGLYYDRDYGRNWWNYYFEPLAVGDRQNAKIVKDRIAICQETAILATNKMSLRRCNQLINRYIKIKPDLLMEIDQFVVDHFQEDYIIGIHYRGTDKITTNEAKFTDYSTVADAVREQLSIHQSGNYQIFVATDEEAFLVYMKEQFPDRIICQETAQRSTNDIPIHLRNDHPYQIGKEAVIDAIVLSRCDFLIRTLSNLSICSCYFNPLLPNRLL